MGYVSVCRGMLPWIRCCLVLREINCVYRCEIGRDNVAVPEKVHVWVRPRALPKRLMVIYDRFILLRDLYCRQSINHHQDVLPVRLSDKNEILCNPRSIRTAVLMSVITAEDAGLMWVLVLLLCCSRCGIARNFPVLLPSVYLGTGDPIHNRDPSKIRFFLEAFNVLLLNQIKCGSMPEELDPEIRRGQKEHGGEYLVLDHSRGGGKGETNISTGGKSGICRALPFLPRP